MHQVSNQPDQPTVPSEPGESHVCPRNACRTCNCTTSCADDDTGDGIDTGVCASISTERVSASGLIKRCAISGQSCPGIKCREWCEGSGNGSTPYNDWGTATPTDNN
jgi:hypothetical protein